MVTVTGGTGVLGREVVPRLQADGHEVAVLNRRPAAPLPDGVRRLVGDLAAGRGLEMTVQGADVIVHLASRPSRPARVDVAGTMALVDAIRRDGGRPHVVYVSIVGVDRIPWPYYKRKRQVEALVTGSGLPFTIQRATQFHDLVLTVGLRRVRAGDGRARRDLLPARGRRRCRGSPGPDRMVRAGGWLRRRPGRPAGP